MQENIKQDLEFIKEIKQKLCTTNNIVNVCSCLGLYILEDVINLSLDVRHRVNVAHDQDLEDFLAAICNDDEYKSMVRV